jgi:hypothetical protein
VTRAGLTVLASLLALLAVECAALYLIVRSAL